MHRAMESSVDEPEGVLQSEEYEEPEGPNGPDGPEEAEGAEGLVEVLYMTRGAQMDRWKLGCWCGMAGTLRRWYEPAYGPDMEFRKFPCRVAGASVVLKQAAFLALREHRVFPREGWFDGSTPELAAKYADVLRRLTSSETAPPPALCAGSTAAEVAGFMAWCSGMGLDVCASASSP